MDPTAYSFLMVLVSGAVAALGLAVIERMILEYRVRRTARTVALLALIAVYFFSLSITFGVMAYRSAPDVSRGAIERGNP